MMRFGLGLGEGGSNIDETPPHLRIRNAPFGSFLDRFREDHTKWFWIVLDKFAQNGSGLELSTWPEKTRKIKQKNKKTPNCRFRWIVLFAKMTQNDPTK